MRKIPNRQYLRSSSIVFLKTKEHFGGLSNMAGGYPILVNGLRIFTSEALYQACRYPHLPDIQRMIIGQTSPMTAKMRSKPYRDKTREDWLQVRVRVMRWCLKAKLYQNWQSFSELLLKTDDLPIVEESRKDTFWGATPVDAETLFGANVLGRLLMELREEIKKSKIPEDDQLLPLGIPNFSLDGKPIQAIKLSLERDLPVAKDLFE